MSNLFRIVFVLLTVRASTNIFAAKQSVIAGYSALPEIETDKARVFFSFSLKPISNEWLYDWNIKKVKADWGYAGIFKSEFNMLKREHQGYEALFRKLNVKQTKRKYKKVDRPTIGNYYVDLPPQELELLLVALTPNALPGRVRNGGVDSFKLRLEPGKAYQLIYGKEDNTYGRLRRPAIIRNISLSKEDYKYCNEYRDRDLASLKAKEVRQDLYDNGFNNYAKVTACTGIIYTKPFSEIDSRTSKWVVKKQDKFMKWIQMQDKIEAKWKDK